MPKGQHLACLGILRSTCSGKLLGRAVQPLDSYCGTESHALIDKVPTVANSGTSAFVRLKLATSSRSELTDVMVIVSCRRGLGSLKLLEPLADRLGAAMGACVLRWTWAPCPTTGRSGRPARWSRQPLHRRKHLGRDPAPGRHKGLKDHRCHQQGLGGADLRGGRLRHRRRSVRDRLLICHRA